MVGLRVVLFERLEDPDLCRTNEYADVDAKCSGKAGAGDPWGVRGSAR